MKSRLSLHTSFHCSSPYCTFSDRRQILEGFEVLSNLLFIDVVVNIKYLDYVTFQGICQDVARLCDKGPDLPVMEIKRSFDIDLVGRRIAIEQLNNS